MGSGFVPSGIYGGKLGAMAAILAETDAYETFVGEVIAATGTSGMYFYGIDRRDLAANDEEFPAAFVMWDWAQNFEKYSTQAGGVEFKFRGGVILTIEADTPVDYVNNTPGAMNWILGHAQDMVRGMELLFGHQGRQEVAAHRVIEGPYREFERGAVDYCGVVIQFELRN